MGEGRGEGGAGPFDVSGRLGRQRLTLPSPTRGEGITHGRILVFGKSRQRQLKNCLPLPGWERAGVRVEQARSMFLRGFAANPSPYPLPQGERESLMCVFWSLARVGSVS